MLQVAGTDWDKLNNFFQKYEEFFSRIRDFNKFFNHIVYQEEGDPETSCCQTDATWPFLFYQHMEPRVLLLICRSYFKITTVKHKVGNFKC